MIVRLRVLTFPETVKDETTWIAAVIERDIVAQAGTPDSAMAWLRSVLAMELRIAPPGHRDRELFSWLDPAPRLAERWDEGTDERHETLTLADVPVELTIRTLPPALAVGGVTR